eukprot:3799760-Amphidinium_carterae.1
MEQHSSSECLSLELSNETLASEAHDVSRFRNSTANKKQSCGNTDVWSLWTKKVFSDMYTCPPQENAIKSDEE